MAILSKGTFLPRLHLTSARSSYRAVVNITPCTLDHTIRTPLAASKWNWLSRSSQDGRTIQIGILEDSRSSATLQLGALLLIRNQHDSAHSVKDGSLGLCHPSQGKTQLLDRHYESGIQSAEILARAVSENDALGSTRKQKEARANKRRRDYPRVPGFTSAFISVRGISPTSSISVPKALPDHGGDCAVIDPCLESSGDSVDASGSETDTDVLEWGVFRDGLPAPEGVMATHALMEGRGMRKKWFPYLDEFKVNAESPALTSKTILEMLDPFLVDGRKQRIQSVVANRTYTVCPVVEGLLDPGNVAAVFRSADALGYQSVHVISNRENKRYRKNKRVSVGAEKWLDVESWSSTSSCVEALRSRGYRIAVTHIAPDTIPIHEMDWTIPTAVFFGNEDQGITEEAIMLSDIRCSIPMSGMVDSFNVSVAAGILMHYAAYDRLSRTGCHGDLLPEQQQVLTAEFCMRHSRQIPGIVDRLLDESNGARKGCLSSVLNGELGADVEPPDYLKRT